MVDTAVDTLDSTVDTVDLQLAGVTRSAALERWEEVAEVRENEPDFRITPVKAGFNTVRLHWSKTGICSVLTLGASLGLIIFTVLIRKSEKQ